jgi:hypothetical protein
MRQSRKALRHGEVWVNCAAAREAYERARQHGDVPQLREKLDSGPLDRIRGGTHKQQFARMQKATVNLFALTAGVSLSSLLVGGTGDALPPGTHLEERTVARYYEYISAAKIDMITSQLKNDGSFSEDRIGRLEQATAHILKTGRVGNLQNPDLWVYDTTIAKYGYVLESDKVIAYGGLLLPRSEHDRYVGYFLLAGSAGHIVGAQPTSAVDAFGMSALPRLIRALFMAEEMLESTRLKFPDDEERLERISGKGDFSYSMDWQTFLRNACTRGFTGPSVEIEFLAKKLLYFDHEGGSRYLLATPLYVARLD